MLSAPGRYILANMLIRSPIIPFLNETLVDKVALVSRNRDFVPRQGRAAVGIALPAEV